jgi:hypothetical protein
MPFHRGWVRSPLKPNEFDEHGLPLNSAHPTLLPSFAAYCYFFLTAQVLHTWIIKICHMKCYTPRDGVSHYKETGSIYIVFLLYVAMAAPMVGMTGSCPEHHLVSLFITHVSKVLSLAPAEIVPPMLLVVGRKLFLSRPWWK